MNVKTMEDVLMTILVVAVRQGVRNMTVGTVYVALSWKKRDLDNRNHSRPSPRVPDVPHPLIFV